MSILKDLHSSGSCINKTCCRARKCRWLKFEDIPISDSLEKRSYEELGCLESFRNGQSLKTRRKGNVNLTSTRDFNRMKNFHLAIGRWKIVWKALFSRRKIDIIDDWRDISVKKDVSNVSVSWDTIEKHERSCQCKYPSLCVHDDPNKIYNELFSQEASRRYRLLYLCWI